MKHTVPIAGQQVQSGTDGRTRRFVFLVLPSFSAFDLTAAIEALKDANGVAGAGAYAWRVVSRDGNPVVSSSGLNVASDAGLEPLERGDTLVVLNGEDFFNNTPAAVLGWLRTQARKVERICAISSGVHSLLRAGIIRQGEVATHWTYRDGLQETFPDICVNRAVFSSSGRIFTCSGGLGTVDLMLHLIAQDRGPVEATWVADNLVCPVPRTMRCEQTLSLCTRMDLRNAVVAQAVTIMQEHLEAPLSPAAIAAAVGVSPRQLERLFARHLGASPKVHYMKLRMQHARSLLLQTDMQVIDVGIAAGFNSASHFGKLYRRHFGVSPHRERGFHTAGPA